MGKALDIRKLKSLVFHYATNFYSMVTIIQWSNFSQEIGSGMGMDCIVFPNTGF